MRQHLNIIFTFWLKNWTRKNFAVLYSPYKSNFDARKSLSYFFLLNIHANTSIYTLIAKYVVVRNAEFDFILIKDNTNQSKFLPYNWRASARTNHLSAINLYGTYITVFPYSIDVINSIRIKILGQVLINHQNFFLLPFIHDLIFNVWNRLNLECHKYVLERKLICLCVNLMNLRLLINKMELD